LFCWITCGKPEEAKNESAAIQKNAQMAKSNLFFRNRHSKRLCSFIMDPGRAAWMKALAVMLMAYIFISVLFSRLQPFPFFSAILAQMIFPFGSKISWLDLFKIYLGFYVLLTVLNVQQLFSLPSIYMNLYPEGAWLAPYTSLIYLMLLPVAASLNSTFIKFIGSHVHPKMLRRLGI
jgi:hypothetical protein